MTKYIVYLITFYFISLSAKHIVPITLEYAQTEEQRTWGLMNHEEIEEGHGMLFIYPYPQKVSLWMFNCLSDLSVAFLDENGVIQEIDQLIAYPWMMDPNRPVKSIDDFSLYPRNDPVVRFFIAQGVSSSSLTSRVLEVKKGWFKENQIKQGDQLIWDPSSPGASIISHDAEDVDKK